jgi:galactokinase/galacturonokinase
VLVAFTGIPRNLPGTGFNQRVAECRAAAAHLSALAGLPPARLLGELSDEVFEAHGAALPDGERRRARHFFGERARVRRGTEAWRGGDLPGFGRLMNESCASSIENYEVGSPELIRLQEILRETPGVLGARFSGGGYGGCAIALVAADAAEEARGRAERGFLAAFPGLAGRARCFLAESEDGLRVV